MYSTYILYKAGARTPYIPSIVCFLLHGHSRNLSLFFLLFSFIFGCTWSAIFIQTIIFLTYISFRIVFFLSFIFVCLNFSSDISRYSVNNYMQLHLSVICTCKRAQANQQSIDWVGLRGCLFCIFIWLVFFNWTSSIAILNAYLYWALHVHVDCIGPSRPNWDMRDSALDRPLFNQKLIRQDYGIVCLWKFFSIIVLQTTEK